jgi:hypothetical protein
VVRQALKLAALALVAIGLAGKWPHARACDQASCVAGVVVGLVLATFIAWVACLLLDYLWHHARLVLLPAAAAVLASAALYPGFASGLGFALLALLREEPEAGPGTESGGSPAAQAGLPPGFPEETRAPRS